MSDFGLSILVIGDGIRRPYWIPVDLFEITDKSIPSNWSFTVVRGHLVRALWGYDSLISDPNHHDDLINRKEQARIAFLLDNNLESMEDA